MCSCTEDFPNVLQQLEAPLFSRRIVNILADCHNSLQKRHEAMDGEVPGHDIGRTGAAEVVIMGSGSGITDSI
jgi:hypothetical protein